MKRFLAIALVSLPVLFSAGCTTIQRQVQDIAAALPPNSFDKIQVGVAIGPFTHTLTLLGGEKDTDGTMRVKNAEAETSWLNWGTKAEIVNLTIIPVGAVPIPTMPPVTILTPAPLAIPPK